MNTPSRARIITTYALLGPLIGGTTVVLGSLASAPSLATAGEFILVALLFSYPFGFVQAVVCGVLHSVLMPRYRPALATAAICASGVAMTGLMACLIGNPRAITQSWESAFGFALPPVVSVLVLSTFLHRRGKNASLPPPPTAAVP